MRVIIKSVLLVILLALCASVVYAGSPYTSCSRTTSQGGWTQYSGTAICGNFWLGWGGNGDSTDRARISTSSAGIYRDMYLTYRHNYSPRASGDTSADHWAYSEGSYSGNAPVNQRLALPSPHTVATRPSYNSDDWLEVGSDDGGSMDTIVQEGQFYPELDAI